MYDDTTLYDIGLDKDTLENNLQFATLFEFTQNVMSREWYDNKYRQNKTNVNIK